jgi:hypothetical protein
MGSNDAVQQRNASMPGVPPASGYSRSVESPINAPVTHLTWNNDRGALRSRVLLAALECPSHGREDRHA